MEKKYPTLILPIKKKWFDMIRAGKKKEEYREIKPYYETRFNKLFADNDTAVITLRNGYSKSSPSIDCLVSLKVGKGKQEWGAEPNKNYYILSIVMLY